MPHLPPPVQRVFALELGREANMPVALAGDEPLDYLLVSGCAVREDPAGKALSVHWPGELIGSPLETRTLSACRLLAGQREAVERARQTDAEFASWAYGLAAQNCREMHERIDWFINRRAEDRILSVLWLQTERAVATTGSATIPLAQIQVAQLAGATRETASMLLHRLREGGLIEYRRRCIEVPDPERLRVYLAAAIARAGVPEPVPA